MKLGLTIGGTGTAKVHAGLRALNGSDALVGIPEAKAPRWKRLTTLTKGGKARRTSLRVQQPINNAQLLFIHTNGSPVRGIPARPVIEPAIAQPDTAAQIAKQLAKAAVAALDGDIAGLRAGLDRAGTIGEAASKQWFTNPKNNWAPNTPGTIARKGSDKPLIDTGAMRRAITHVVEISASAKQGMDEADTASKSGTDTVATSQTGEVTELAEMAEGAETLAVLL